MPRRGKFITFEGLDGTGKSTQMRKLAAVLRDAGYKVIETREPGGTPTAEKIRKVLLDSGTAGLSPLAEMALMFASRAQHIAEVIEPGLASGNIVLCDRFTDSTEAYQGSGRRLGSEPVRELHRVLCGDLQPDLTILMDSNPQASVNRARRRNRSASKHSSGSHDENRFEQETRSFFARVREGYLAIAKREPERVVVVDARGTPEQTHRNILQILFGRLGLGGLSKRIHHGHEPARRFGDAPQGWSHNSVALVGWSVKVAMNFRRLQWLFPVAVALHNGEEAIWMPGWDARHAAELPVHPPGAFEFRVVLFVLTVATFVITSQSARHGPESTWAYLTFGSIVAMLVNVFVPHVPAAILFHGYAPGVVTAVSINLPLASWLALRAVRERWVGGWKAVAFGAGVPIVIGSAIVTWIRVH